MSHASAWQRDDMRLRDLLPRVATLPLGSGALAGNPFLVDRQFLAQELGMVRGWVGGWERHGGQALATSGSSYDAAAQHKMTDARCMLAQQHDVLLCYCLSACRSEVCAPTPWMLSVTGTT
jgi:hypothetical protein